MKQQLIKALRLRLKRGYSARLVAQGIMRQTNRALARRGLLRCVAFTPGHSETMVITTEGMRVARRLLEYGA